MSEPRGEEQQEEEVGDRAGRDQAIDRLQRTKPDHSHSSQGPLSSIRAAIKRSRSTSQSDHARERRRPEITILSAEPLANSSWFPGASGIFTSSSPPPPPSPASQSSWPGSVQADPQPPPSYDQVIKEKTQEEHVARPTAAPRRLACTSTSATQTDPVREETSVSPRLSPAGGTGRKPDVKKPQKPPRPQLVKAQRKEPIVKSEPTNRRATNVTVSVATGNQNESKSCVEQRNTKDSTHTCSRSVTVQWDDSDKNSVELKVPTDSQSTPVDSSTPSSDSVPAECPVPLPRFKKSRQKHLTEEVTVQTLVSLRENGDDIRVTSSNDQEEPSSNKYIEELLEVFGEDNSSLLENNTAAESISTEQSTVAGSEMSAIHSQRDVRGRIAAFETQPSTEEEMVAQRPKPQPRNVFRPPVSSKPTIASRTSFKYSVENNNVELPSMEMPQKPSVAPKPQKPSPAPRFPPAMKPGGYHSTGDLQEIMPSKVPVLPPSHLSIKAKVKSLEQQQQEESHSWTPSVPEVKPFKEPLIPNHNSAIVVTEDEHYDRPSNFIGDLQETMPSRVLVLPPSRSSIMAKVKSLELQQESHALTPPVPAVKPFKEPLIPDTHNSTFMATEDEYVNTPLRRPSIMAKVKSLELQQESHALTRPAPPAKPFKEPLIPDTHNSTFMATEDQYYDRPSNSIGDLQETMPSRVLVLPPSRSSIMAKVKSLELQQESHALTRPVPPAKPFKEPVIPNTHNSTFMAAEDEYVNAPSNFIENLQETRPSKVPVLPLSGPSIKVKSLDLQQESHALTPPVPPVKPFKEPLMPNLNLNNHNSTFMATEDQYYDRPSNSIEDLQEMMPSRVPVLPPSYLTPPVPPTKLFKEPPIPNLNHISEDEFDRPSNRAPFKPQHSLDSYPNKESISRRPTTIRVNSMASRSLSVDTPPPLPTQMPVGSLLPPETFNKGQEPTLPPRTSGGKVLPPRPPPAKAGPARPPPPSAGPVQASQRGPPSTAPVQKSKRRGPALPPRPRPGHNLYNKYTLELPHGIAVCNYNGPKTDELSFQKNDVLVLLEMVDHRTVMCQSGEIKGLVQSCHMRVITPLATQNDPPQITNPASSVGGGGLQVQAIHDFKPESQEELGLRAGDVVNMVEQVDDEWYRGTCRGSTGFFPINYVNVLSNSPLPSHEKKKPPATVSGPRCVARFDFEGEQDDELTFSEGDVIGLLEYVGDEWAKGQLGPCTGIFPLNFVDVIEEPLPLPPRQQQTQQQTQTRMALPGLAALPNIQPEAVQPIQAPQVSGPEWVVALYDFNGQTREDLSFRQGDRILVTKHLDVEWWTGRLNGREGVFPRAFVEGIQGQSVRNSQKKSEAGGSRARALFQFTADCEEELSIQAGDVITNLETVDEEWFLGDLRGKRALVPKTYVQVLG